MLKKVYDSVHGFIHYSPLEAMVIDSLPFQRLRYIHQLGVSFLFYPGATHKRFEHSLGAMYLATEIFDKITSPECFPKTCKHYFPKDFFKPRVKEYFRLAIRVAALSHDLGHLPFSHVAEKALLESGSHELVTYKILYSELFEPIWKKMPKLKGRSFRDDVAKFALGIEKMKKVDPKVEFTPWEEALSLVITGDYFGADRIDYLLRDARHTGVAYGLIDYPQILETITFVPVGEKLTLGVTPEGIQAIEALLLARHFMHSRVYQYPMVQLISFHMQRFMKAFMKSSSRDLKEDLDFYLSLTDVEVLAALREAAFNPNKSSHEDAESILGRKSKFKTLAFHAHEDEAKIVEELKRLYGSKLHAGFEPKSPRQKKEGLDSFSPLLCYKEGKVELASVYSPLTSELPGMMAPKFLFVDPSVEKEVNGFIERWSGGEKGIKRDEKSRSQTRKRKTR